MKKLIVMMGLLLAITFGANLSVSAQIDCGGGAVDATGRVLNEFNQPVSNVRVTATTIDSRSDTTEPTTRIAYTNTLGYYNFWASGGTELCVSSVYTIQGYKSRYGYTNLIIHEEYGGGGNIVTIFFQ
jgi:hypothetical protein